jgi:hypothetical protein
VRVAHGITNPNPDPIPNPNPNQGASTDAPDWLPTWYGGTAERHEELMTLREDSGEPNP